MQRLEFTVKNHLIAMRSGLLLTITLVGLIFWVNFDTTMMTIFFVMFLIFILPGIYLHIEYFIINYKTIYSISKDEIISFKRGKKKIYKIKDIKSAKVFGSSTLFNPWFHLTAMEQYHFATITFNNGERLIITCLLCPRVDLALEKFIQIERKKGACNSILLSKSI